MLKKRERRKEIWVSSNSQGGSFTFFFPLDKGPDSLQNVNISVISNTECRAAYKTYNIRDTMLCVGIVPGRRQPCKVSALDAFICPFCCVPWPEKTSQVPFSWQEVTAAPAVCDGKLQGILTFADGCVLRADVGIYTRIINYMPWIENTIRNN